MENVDIFYANLEYITAMVLFMVIWYFCGNNPSFLYIYCVKKHLAILVEVSISLAPISLSLESMILGFTIKG
jgi:hypothetical protein